MRPMPVLLRLLRHWRLSKKHGPVLFPTDTLLHFHRLIEAGAPRHRAYLKLAIEVALPTRAVLSRTSARARACALFAQHCAVDKSECNQDCNPEYSHILIYINLADRQVEIVADTAAAQCLSAGQWGLLCDTITQGFSVGKPDQGVDSALRELNGLLEQAMPVANDTMHKVVR